MQSNREVERNSEQHSVPINDKGDDSLSQPKRNVSSSKRSGRRKKCATVSSKRKKGKPRNPYDRKEYSKVCPDTKITVVPSNSVYLYTSKSIRSLAAVLKVSPDEVDDLNDYVGFKLMNHRSLDESLSGDDIDLKTKLIMMKGFLESSQTSHRRNIYVYTKEDKKRKKCATNTSEHARNNDNPASKKQKIITEERMQKH